MAPYPVRPTRPRSYLDFSEKSINLGDESFSFDFYSSFSCGLTLPSKIDTKISFAPLDNIDARSFLIASVHTYLLKGRVRTHTVGIWTFTFHKKLGCVYLIDLEGKF